MLLRSFRRFVPEQQGNCAVALAFVIGVCSSQPAWALIFGGEGNKPINDPGWPKGAAAVFNSEFRVAYWEGPPFGGGQWHAECKGDASALNVVLADFAKVDIPQKRIVLHDGFGQSFWLNPSRDKEKKDKALIDWAFMVWQPDRLQFQRGLPAGLRALEQRDQPLLAQFDVYTGGFIRWADVIVPDGVEVVDQRLEAHGFSEADGTVLEGKVTDLATKQPLSAKMVLERIEPLEKGGYRHTPLAEVTTNAEGRWVLTRTPAGWCRMVIVAEGYVPRVIGYGQFDEKPQWSEHTAGLSKPATVAGRVVDEQGKPLADVEVRISDLEATPGGRYEIADASPVKTDGDGRFRFESAPWGTASVWIHKPGYVRPGLGPKFETPATDLKLTMQPSATLQVRVDFSASKRPDGYIVTVKPEGGEKIGSWGGSGNIDADDQITYQNVPAGRYVVTGMPNPGNAAQQTDPVTVDLKGGMKAETTIKAK